MLNILICKTSDIFFTVSALEKLFESVDTHRFIDFFPSEKFVSQPTVVFVISVLYWLYVFGFMILFIILLFIYHFILERFGGME